MMQDFTVPNGQPYGTFKNGTPVTDADIERWADEAEQGYDFPPEVIQHAIRRGGRPSLGGDGDGTSPVVPVRLDQALAAALDDRASTEHTTRSEVIRAALRAWLAA